jgi:hypothetical protein
VDGCAALTRIQWKHLPAELGFGRGVPCWRRDRAWQQAGVWERLHHLLIDQLGEQSRLNWSLVVVGTRSVPATRGAFIGLNPKDRRKPGSKQFVAVDRSGIPLAVTLGAASERSTPRKANRCSERSCRLRLP